MDIDLLSKMVKELILDNDRVVLPGLGSFVAETVPASFSDKGYTINPPYRRLSFRSRPDDGDALALFYASSNGLEFDIADKVIRDFIAELKSILYIRKTVVFPGLGRMRATKENTVFFVADENLDIYPDGIGLEPISLKTHQETDEEVGAAIAELKAIVEEKPQVKEEIPAEPEPALTEVIPVPVEEPEQAPEQSSVEIPVEIPVEAPDVEVYPKSEKPNNAWKTILKTLLWLLLVAVVMLAVFVALSRFAPELLDNILYTKEELQILNGK